MNEENTNLDLSVKEYYKILRGMCKTCEENPDDEIALNLFVDAAYNLAKADIERFIPDDLFVEDKINDGPVAPENNIVTSVDYPHDSAADKE